MAYKHEKLDEGIYKINITQSITGPEAEKFKNCIEQLIEEKPTNLRLILDFEKINNFSSSSIGTIISTYKQIIELNGRIALTNISEKIEQILKVSNLNTKFEVYKTVEDAKAALKKI